MEYNFGPVLKLLRKERGMTLQKLADLSGVKRSTINSYELGTKAISATKIAKIAKALDVPVVVIYYMAEREAKKSEGSDK